MKRLLVFVPGVEKAQWRECFQWGDFVAPLADLDLDDADKAIRH